MKPRFSIAAVLVVLAGMAGTVAPAHAFFRAGGWHAGGIGGVGGWHAGGIGPAGGVWHAGGWDAGGWHGGGWDAGGWHGGGYWGGGFHGPVVVNHYYGGGCWACGGAAVAAGVAAGAAAAYAIGSTVATIPAACANQYVGGVNYFVCGGTWFQPFYGNNGVYYRVVPPL
jgi:hypothetical protein